MNVVIITTEYSPYNNVGGIATFTSALAKLLVRLGHRVFVITDIRNGAEHGTHETNPVIVPLIHLSTIPYIRKLSVTPVGKLFVRLCNIYIYSTSRLVAYNISTFITFVTLKRSVPVHVIHTPVLYAPAGFIKLFFPRIPVITHAQGPDELLQTYDTVSPDTKLKARIETAYMRRSAFVVSCSRAVHTYLLKKNINMHADIVHIPNFIDEHQFGTQTKDPDPNMLLFFGRLEFRKGADLTVKAFITLAQQHPKLTLTLIGEDTNGWSLRGISATFSEYVNAMKLPKSIRRRIVFVPREDNRSRLIRKVSSTPGIAVLPSRYEPFGYVYIESMLSGCITIASSVGGGSEIIRNGVSGFTVHPTVEDVVMRLRTARALTQRQREQLVMRAKKTVLDRYTMQRVERAYRLLYRQFSTDISSSRSTQIPYTV